MDKNKFGIKIENEISVLKSWRKDSGVTDEEFETGLRDFVKLIRHKLELKAQEIIKE